MAIAIILLLVCVEILSRASGKEAVTYILHADSKEWSHAQTICVSHGGHLVHIQDTISNYALSYFTLTELWKQYLYGNFWIGLFTTGEDLKWTDCRILSSPTFWEVADNNTDEGCVRAHSLTLEWSAITCDTKLQYVCQVDAGPCEYKSSTRSACNFNQVTRQTVAVETEAECQKSCDTEEDENGQPCWGYFYNGSSSKCILLHSTEPILCDSSDLSLSSADIYNIRTCFYFDVTKSSEEVITSWDIQTACKIVEEYTYFETEVLSSTDTTMCEITETAPYLESSFYDYTETGDSTLLPSEISSTIVPSTSISTSHVVGVASLQSVTAAASVIIDISSSHLESSRIMFSETTTQRPTENLPSNSILCPCNKPLSNSYQNMTTEEDVIQRRELQIEKSSLSSVRRKLTSATDSRRSVQTMGWVAVFFVTAPIGLMVLSDLASCVKSVTVNFKKNALKSL